MKRSQQHKIVFLFFGFSSSQNNFIFCIESIYLNTIFVTEINMKNSNFWTKVTQKWCVVEVHSSFTQTYRESGLK